MNDFVLNEMFHVPDQLEFTPTECVWERRSPDRTQVEATLRANPDAQNGMVVESQPGARFEHVIYFAVWAAFTTNQPVAVMHKEYSTTVKPSDLKWAPPLDQYQTIAASERFRMIRTPEPLEAGIAVSIGAAACRGLEEYYLAEGILPGGGTE